MGVVLEASCSVWGASWKGRASNKGRGFLNAFSEPLKIYLGRFLEAFWNVSWSPLGAFLERSGELR